MSSIIGRSSFSSGRAAGALTTSSITGRSSLSSRRGSRSLTISLLASSHVIFIRVLSMTISLRVWSMITSWRSCVPTSAVFASFISSGLISMRWPSRVACIMSSGIRYSCAWGTKSLRNCNSWSMFNSLLAVDPVRAWTPNEEYSTAPGCLAISDATMRSISVMADPTRPGERSARSPFIAISSSIVGLGPNLSARLDDIAHLVI